MKKNPVNEELLTRYLLGEATQAEQEDVLNWLDESSEHHEQYEQLQLIWSQSKSSPSAPAVDVEAAWMRFRSGIDAEVSVHEVSKTRSWRWLKVAAVLLLLAGGAAAYFLKDEEPAQQEEHAAIGKPAETIESVEPGAATDQTTATTFSAAEAQQVPLFTANILPKPAKARKIPPAAIRNDLGYTAASPRKEMICNSTACPIEICIVQTMKCSDGVTQPVSVCSVLEPDQSGHLHYKSFDKPTVDCNLAVEEIRIKRMTTGETIVLNGQSSPSTAQEFFDYITGERKGDILAGIFHSDCNNYCNDHSLCLDNTQGDLVIQ